MTHAIANLKFTIKINPSITHKQDKRHKHVDNL